MDVFLAKLVTFWLTVGWPLKGLLLLMAIDIAVGVIYAWRADAFQPAELRRGLMAKWLTLFVVLATWVIGKMVPGIFPDLPPAARDLPLADVACIAFGLYELSSIYRTAKAGGAGVPAFLVNAVKALSRLWSGEEKPDGPAQPLPRG